MRRSLALAASLLLLTACGGSEEDDAAPAPATTEPTTAAAESTAPEASSQFCTDAAGIQARITATFGGQTDRAMLPDVLREAAAEIRAVEPPAELAGDWTAFADGIEQIAAAAQIDFDDPAAVAEFQQQAAAAQQEYGSAFAGVTTYLAEECGLIDAPTETSAPAS